jgi:DNA-binding MarR family transcriptional regulator
MARASGTTDESGLVVDVGPVLDGSKVVAAAIALSLAATDSKVTLPQLRVLVMVDSRGPLNMTAVAEGLGVNASNASRTCDRLVSTGLVARGELTADRRHCVLTLTRRGRTFVERLMARREQELAEIVARMSDTDYEALMRALTPFNEAAAADLHPAVRASTSRDPRLHEWGI